jgi:ABC-type antimicrobial peptide transport system permease subunit
VQFTVRRRTSEIGLRLALGASRRSIAAHVLRHVTYVAGAGLVVGLVATFVTMPALSSVLFGVAPTDPATVAVVTLTMILVTMGACVVPLRRATSIDPAVALRCE